LKNRRDYLPLILLELPPDHLTFRGLALELRALMGGRLARLDSGTMNTEAV
jgi:hypothetical protein